MDIGSSVKEHAEKSVKCKASSSNPDSFVDIDFFINGTKQTDKKPQVSQTLGSNSGRVKTFTFTFTTDRNQHGKIAKCLLKWTGAEIKMKEAILNITCK